MEGPIQYPDDFKEAVMAQFPGDKGVQALLDNGSYQVRTLLEARFGQDHLPFSATQVHKALNEGHAGLLVAIKRDSAKIADWGELLDRFKKIYEQYLLHG